MNTYFPSFSRFLAFALFFVSLSACSGSDWHDAEEWGPSGLWSDDGQSILVHKKLFERGQNNNPFDLMGDAEITRNYEVQFYTVPANNLEDLTPLGPRLSGRYSSEHYMHNEGYALIERYIDVSNDRNQISIDKISLNGTVDNIINRNEGGGWNHCHCGSDGSSGWTHVPHREDLLLSPDGSSFARFDFVANSSGTTGTITFLNASDLSATEGPSPLKLPELYKADMDDTDGSLRFAQAWLESGEMVAGFYNECSAYQHEQGYCDPSPFTGWKYAPGQEPSPVENISQECISTTIEYNSSQRTGATNSQGQRIEVVDNGEGNPTISVVDDPDYNPPGQPDCW